MHQEKRDPWIIRTYAGFGDAESSNKRFRENLAKGQKGLSIAFDLPTQNGFDATDAMAQGEIGASGVAVSHLGDMELLLKGIDLGAVNTSMTINATAPWLFALYLALAKKRGVAWDQLRGTTQNDLLKEIVARGTHIFNPEVSLRLCCDLITFAAEHAPQWNPINCCGYHYMESGADPAQEIGFAFGNAMVILDRIRPNLSQELFTQTVKTISFFINSGLELVPEICKVRAYAKLWPEICEKEYGVRSVRFRAGCQVRSLTLTEQQPENNIVRIAYEALPVVLSAGARVGALQLPGFREAMALPDEAEQTLSLRTQQILMHETGIADYPDIFEGSKVIEALTNDIKEKARQIANALRHEGYEKGIPVISKTLTQGLVKLRSQWESGEKTVVGVNAFMEPVNLVAGKKNKAVSNAAGIARHLQRLATWKKRRKKKDVEDALMRLKTAARNDENILLPSIMLAEAGGTTGEWTAALLEVFGPRYQAPLGFEERSQSHLNLPQADKPYRVLIGKCGLDGHINAIKLLAYACRQSGLEVVFTGIQQTPEQMVRAALQEDVDVIGVSTLAGAHLHIAKELQRLLKKEKLSKVPVVMGGIIPEADKAKLKTLGIRAVFTPKDGQIHTVVERLIDEARAYDKRRRR